MGPLWSPEETKTGRNSKGPKGQQGPKSVLEVLVVLCVLLAEVDREHTGSGGRSPAPRRVRGIEGEVEHREAVKPEREALPGCTAVQGQQQASGSAHIEHPGVLRI